jgi:branched-chain amino acid transport system permease protein
MDLRATTLWVFMISAGLAGLGGAVYAMGPRSVSAGQFELVAGAAILLAVVVGGVRSIGSAVFAGAFIGGPTLANLFPNLSQLTSMTIALSAVAIGANPNGIVVDALRPRWSRVLGTPRVLAGGVGALACVWVLRLAGVIDNWRWALASLAVLVAMPAAGTLTGVRRPAATLIEVRHGAA